MRLLAALSLRSAEGARRWHAVPAGQPQADRAVQGFCDAGSSFRHAGSDQSEHAEQLFELAQRDIDDQWHYYEQMAGVQRDIVDELDEVEA